MCVIFAEIKQILDTYNSYTTYKFVNGNNLFSKPVNILSFDLEEWYLGRTANISKIEKWYHLEQRAEIGTNIFLEILDSFDLKATFFVMGWLAEQRPELIQKIAAKGHEIGYHSYYHQNPVNLTPDQFEFDLQKGLNLIKAITGYKPVMYRAPMFAFTEKTLWAVPILLRNGIRISSSFKSNAIIQRIHTGNSPFYISHDKGLLLEFPLSRLSLSGMNLVYSGSGFLRILPESVLLELFGRSYYNMAYFHPRDFDIKMPVSPKISLYRNLINKLGNHSTRSKLETIIKKFEFVSMMEASKKIAVYDLPIIDMNENNDFILPDLASGL